MNNFIDMYQSIDDANILYIPIGSSIFHENGTKLGVSTSEVQDGPPYVWIKSNLNGGIETILYLNTEMFYIPPHIVPIDSENILDIPIGSSIFNLSGKKLGISLTKVLGRHLGTYNNGRPYFNNYNMGSYVLIENSTINGGLATRLHLNTNMFYIPPINKIHNIYTKTYTITKMRGGSNFTRKSKSKKRKSKVIKFLRMNR